MTTNINFYFFIDFQMKNMVSIMMKVDMVDTKTRWLGN